MTKIWLSCAALLLVIIIAANPITNPIIGANAQENEGSSVLEKELKKLQIEKETKEIVPELSWPYRELDRGTYYWAMRPMLNIGSIAGLYSVSENEDTARQIAGSGLLLGIDLLLDILKRDIEDSFPMYSIGISNIYFNTNNYFNHSSGGENSSFSEENNMLLAGLKLGVGMRAPLLRSQSNVSALHVQAAMTPAACISFITSKNTTNQGTKFSKLTTVTPCLKSALEVVIYVLDRVAISFETSSLLHISSTKFGEHDLYYDFYFTTNIGIGWVF